MSFFVAFEEETSTAMPRIPPKNLERLNQKTPKLYDLDEKQIMADIMREEELRGRSKMARTSEERRKELKKRINN